MEVLIIAALVVLLIFFVVRGQNTGRCRQCRKRVRRDAKVCPYCGNDFTATTAPEGTG